MPMTRACRGYSANKNLGGGILLDAIHELDYLYYKFGPIKDISYIKTKLTNITNDTEDLTTGRIKFNNGTIADFTLNYLSEKYQRYYDILDGEMLKRTHLNLDNEMYIKEINYFIDCVKSNKKCQNDFFEASNLLKHLI